MREGTASAQLSLKAEIDQFRLDEEGAPERPVELSDSKTELDRLSMAHPSKRIVARADSNSKEEGMDRLKGSAGQSEQGVGFEGSSPGISSSRSSSFAPC